jgi:hypothetical protein
MQNKETMTMSEKLHLTISSGNGDWEHDFTPNEPVHAVKTAAMAHLNLDPSQAEKFILTFNGKMLDESLTLAELGINSGSVLILEPTGVTKI